MIEAEATELNLYMETRVKKLFAAILIGRPLNFLKGINIILNESAYTFTI